MFNVRVVATTSDVNPYLQPFLLHLVVAEYKTMSNLLQNIKWKSATFAITATAATLTGSFILFHLYFKRNLTIGDKRRPKEEKASSSKDEQVFLPPLPDSIVSLLRYVIIILCSCSAIQSI